MNEQKVVEINASAIGAQGIQAAMGIAHIYITQSLATKIHTADRDLLSLRLYDAVFLAQQSLRRSQFLLPQKNVPVYYEYLLPENLDPLTGNEKTIDMRAVLGKINNDPILVIN